MRIIFTDVSIRQFPNPETGQVKLRDTVLPGFGCIVGKKTKSFFVMYGPDRATKTIGKYPEISLKEARLHAKRLLAHPLPKKRAESFSEALSDFIFDCRARLRPSTADRYWYSLKTLNWKKLSDHKPVTEPNLLKALKVFYNWCVEQGRFDRNPYLGKQVVFGVRERVLTDDEIAAIWRYDHPPYSDILKALILTGQRRNQIWRFEQDWIEGDELTFPSSIMKGKKAHTIPVTGYSSYLYPYSFNSWSKAKVRIDKHVGFSDWVVHDFRRYFSTTMARIGTPLHVTEQIMDHRSTVSGVAAIYNRYSFLPEMKDALEKYEAHVHSIAT